MVLHSGTEGIVLEQRRVGVVDAEGDVLRRVQVVISKAPAQAEIPTSKVASAHDSDGEEIELSVSPAGDDEE